MPPGDLYAVDQPRRELTDRPLLVVAHEPARQRDSRGAAEELERTSLSDG
jgi:hypothetical protein